MSMSIRCEGCGLEYAGGRGLAGLFAQPRRSCRAGVPGHAGAGAAACTGGPGRCSPAGTEPELHPRRVPGPRARYSPYFVQHFVVPLVSAVWSCGPHVVTEYPARYLFTFLAHHGMLIGQGLAQSGARWSAAPGGTSRRRPRSCPRYGRPRPCVRCTALTRGRRRPGRRRRARRVRRGRAGHPRRPGAARCSPTPTAAERDVLGAFGYSRNETVLHADDVGAAPAGRAPGPAGTICCPAAQPRPGAVRVSYDMNRLQRLDTTAPVVVTLNGASRGAARRACSPGWCTSTPSTPRPRLAAQTRLPDLNDGVHRVRRRLPRLGLPRGRLPLGRRGGRQPGGSVVSARASLRAPQSRTKGALVSAPVRVRARARAVDAGAARSSATARTCGWWTWTRCRVLPWWLRPLARFDARDHLGDPSRPIRSNVDDIPGGPRDRPRRRSGTDARPRPGVRLRVQPADRCTGALRATARRPASIAEVHNTYGGRHCYLLHPDERGRASTDKAFYVSPFYPVDGEYRMHLPEPDERLGSPSACTARRRAAVRGHACVAPGRPTAPARCFVPPCGIPCRRPWSVPGSGATGSICICADCRCSRPASAPASERVR